MDEIEIHNGQVLVNGQAQAREQAQLAVESAKWPSAGPEDIEPEDIAKRMAGTVSLGIANHLTPMEIVNSLLTLNSPRGHKLVWTRFDVHQTFALWSKKMEGRMKL